eukprot:8556312-Alexandrium_andersonii.AAC.1
MHVLEPRLDVKSGKEPTEPHKLRALQPTDAKQHWRKRFETTRTPLRRVCHHYSGRFAPQAAARIESEA